MKRKRKEVKTWDPRESVEIRYSRSGPHPEERSRRERRDKEEEVKPRNTREMPINIQVRGKDREQRQQQIKILETDKLFLRIHQQPYEQNAINV